MFKVPLDKIFIGPRQREDLGDMESLQFSLQQYGLLHPIIVLPLEDGRYKLIAGGRRLQAAINIGWTEINCTLKESLNEVQQKEIELEENLVRQDLDWKEKAKAVADIHRIKAQLYKNSLPGRFALSGWNQKDTANALSMSQSALCQEIALSEALVKYPQLAEAKNRSEALRLLRHLEMGGTQTSEQTVSQLRNMLVSFSIAEALAKTENHSVNLVVTDLHGKKLDTYVPEVLLRTSFTGHCLFFFSLDQLTVLLEQCKLAKVNFNQKPFIWHIKAEDSYSMFLWASPGLGQPPKQLKEIYSYRRDKGLHMLTKPYSLYYAIVESCTLKGQFVCDFSAYDTNLAQACNDLQRNCRIYINNQVLHDQLMMNIK